MKDRSSMASYDVSKIDVIDLSVNGIAEKASLATALDCYNSKLPKRSFKIKF